MIHRRFKLLFLHLNFLTFFYFLNFLICKPLQAQQAQNLEEAKKINATGFNLWKQGKYQEALPIFERLLQISEKEFGPEHISTGISLYRACPESPLFCSG
jgi:hypothetical protein